MSRLAMAWEDAMRSTVHIMVWAAVAGLPEILVAITLTWLLKARARIARQASAKINRLLSVLGHPNSAL